MADIASIPVRFHDANSPYQYNEDNKPIQDVNSRIVLVNEELEDVVDEVSDARGSMPSLTDRLDVILEDDGTLKSGSVTGINASQVDEQESIPSSDDDRVWMTRGEKSKLGGIANKANRVTISFNGGEPIDGAVKLSLGNTMRGGIKTSVDGATELFIDTVFSADRLHEHRYYQNILHYNNAIGLFSNTDDYVIPGSVRLYVNGLMQSKSDFEEYVDETTGRVVGVRVVHSDAESIDLHTDKMWVEYDVRVKLANESSVLSGGGISLLSRFQKTIDTGSDISLVRLPVGSGSAQPYQFWLIDITGLILSPPYDNYLMFITESGRTASSGRVMASYGIDWDIISLNSNRYLRWRYDRNPGATGGAPDPSGTPDRWEFLTESGYGSPSNPATQFATFDLVDGAHFDLMYQSK